MELSEDGRLELRGLARPGAGGSERRLSVRVRLLREPCLWCWGIVDDVSGNEIESSWDTEWCGYPTREEAETAGRARMIAIAPGSPATAFTVAR